MNEKINSPDCGRLFAIIKLSGGQQKITKHDLVSVQGFWPPDINDEIRFEKVMKMCNLLDFYII